jgi:hypothetical protein
MVRIIFSANFLQSSTKKKGKKSFCPPVAFAQWLLWTKAKQKGAKSARGLVINMLFFTHVNPSIKFTRK